MRSYGQAHIQAFQQLPQQFDNYEGEVNDIEGVYSPTTKAIAYSLVCDRLTAKSVNPN